MSALLFWCPKCATGFVAEDTDAGGAVECEACRERFAVPQPDQDTTCLFCGTAVRIAAKPADQAVDCPHCGKRIVVPGAARHLSLKDNGGTGDDTRRRDESAGTVWRQLDEQRARRTRQRTADIWMRWGSRALLSGLTAAVAAAGLWLGHRAFAPRPDENTRDIRCGLMAAYALTAIESGNVGGGQAGIAYALQVCSNTIFDAVLGNADFQARCRNCKGEGMLDTPCTKCPPVVACSACKGSHKCVRCAGTGKAPAACAECGGTGTCAACKGEGVKHDVRQITKRVQVPGKGGLVDTRRGDQANKRWQITTVQEDVVVNCAACQKTGRCAACQGAGRLTPACPACLGTGICKQCPKETRCAVCRGTKTVRAACPSCGGAGHSLSRDLVARKRDGVLATLRDHLAERTESLRCPPRVRRVAEAVDRRDVSNALAMVDVSAPLFFRTCARGETRTQSVATNAAAGP